MGISQIEPGRTERRRHPRVDRNIRLDIQPNEKQGYRIKGETYNISPLGIYCWVDQHVPEMTQLMIILDLPNDKIKCQGTVVRSESDATHADRYDLAIYFHEISDVEKCKLEEYLNS